MAVALGPMDGKMHTAHWRQSCTFWLLLVFCKQEPNSGSQLSPGSCDWLHSQRWCDYSCVVVCLCAYWLFFFPFYWRNACFKPTKKSQQETGVHISLEVQGSAAICHPPSSPAVINPELCIIFACSHQRACTRARSLLIFVGFIPSLVCYWIFIDVRGCNSIKA